MASISPVLLASIERNRRRLWTLCYRMTGGTSDAEDLCQDAMARAIERARDQGNRGQGADPGRYSNVRMLEQRVEHEPHHLGLAHPLAPPPQEQVLDRGAPALEIRDPRTLADHAGSVRAVIFHPGLCRGCRSASLSIAREE